MEKWLKDLRDAPKAAVHQNQVKKVHFTLKNQEFIEEFNLNTKVLVRSCWIHRNPLGSVISTEVEIGDPEPKPLKSDSIIENCNQPIVTRRVTKLNLEWRIRNLPYEIDNYLISVDKQQTTIIVKTVNKKYFKVLKVPDFERIGLQLNSELLTYSYQFKTLIITNIKSAVMRRSNIKMDWAIEKAKILNMELPEKRNNYKSPTFYTINDIENWNEYATKNSKTLPAPKNMAPNFEINHELNTEISKKVAFFHGDITTLEIDCIVNAANQSLLGGGGVDGAIHRAAGPLLKNECRTLRGCETGKSKITGGYCLPSKYVIHTVGPRNQDSTKLRNCYLTSLKLMQENNLRSMAFSSISTGVYGYPSEDACHIACSEIRTFLESTDSNIGNVEEAIKIAVENGYRHIDCAHAYGNEQHIGRALNKLFNRKVVSREDLFITSKLWNDNHDPEKVKKACQQSLEHLQLDYLDLYLMHWPFGYSKSYNVLFPTGETGENDVDYVETWRAMEQLVRDGLTKSIGLSNFNSEQMTRVLNHCSIKPVVNQVELHPYLTQKQLRQFCCERDIRVVAYSPLGSPNSLQSASKQDQFIINNSTVLNIAQKHHKTASQVILRYLIDIGVVPIPKSFNRDRILNNVRIFDFKLSENEVEQMNGLNRNERICDAVSLKSHKHYPFNIQY